MSKPATRLTIFVKWAYNIYIMNFLFHGRKDILVVSVACAEGREKAL
jgi:hypothetical protein